MTTQTLQDRVAEAAKSLAGQSFDGLCGNFVRDVLAGQGIKVEGRLREFGAEVMVEEREPGDIIMLYTNKTNYANNDPLSSGILAGHNEFVGKRGDVIWQCCFNCIFAENEPPLLQYVGGDGGYVRIRRSRM